jgi:hypothetical protein
MQIIDVKINLLIIYNYKIGKCWLVGLFFAWLIPWLFKGGLKGDFGPYGILFMTMCLYYFGFYLYSLRVICYYKNVNIATEVIQRQ